MLWRGPHGGVRLSLHAYTWQTFKVLRASDPSDMNLLRSGRGRSDTKAKHLSEPQTRSDAVKRKSPSRCALSTGLAEARASQGGGLPVKGFST